MRRSSVSLRGPFLGKPSEILLCGLGYLTADRVSLGVPRTIRVDGGAAAAHDEESWDTAYASFRQVRSRPRAARRLDTRTPGRRRRTAGLADFLDSRVLPVYRGRDASPASPARLRKSAPQLE